MIIKSVDDAPYSRVVNFRDMLLVDPRTRNNCRYLECIMVDDFYMRALTWRKMIPKKPKQPGSFLIDHAPWEPRFQDDNGNWYEEVQNVTVQGGV